MSTRGRIIISKGEDKRNFYRHCDCYPSGLGREITEWMNILYASRDKDDIVSDIDMFAEYLDDCGDGDLEFEGNDDGYHGDEEYGYYINLDDETVTCKDVYKYPYKDIYTVSLWADWNPETMDK